MRPCRTSRSLAPGDLFEVPFGPRLVVGVVWDETRVPAASRLRG